MGGVFVAQKADTVHGKVDACLGRVGVVLAKADNGVAPAQGGGGRAVAANERKA